MARVLLSRCVSEGPLKPIEDIIFFGVTKAVAETHQWKWTPHPGEQSQRVFTKGRIPKLCVYNATVRVASIMSFPMHTGQRNFDNFS